MGCCRGSSCLGTCARVYICVLLLPVAKPTVVLGSVCQLVTGCLDVGTEEIEATIRKLHELVDKLEVCRLPRCDGWLVTASAIIGLARVGC